MILTFTKTSDTSIQLSSNSLHSGHIGRRTGAVHLASTPRSTIRPSERSWGAREKGYSELPTAPALSSSQSGASFDVASPMPLRLEWQGPSGYGGQKRPLGWTASARANSPFLSPYSTHLHMCGGVIRTTIRTKHHRWYVGMSVREFEIELLLIPNITISDFIL